MYMHTPCNFNNCLKAAFAVEITSHGEKNHHSPFHDIKQGNIINKQNRLLRNLTAINSKIQSP